MQTRETATSVNDTTAVSPVQQHAPGDAPTFGFVDQRPETAAQLKMQEMANEFTSRNAIQKAAVSTSEPVVQRVELVPVGKRKRGVLRPAQIRTSANFETNHIHDGDLDDVIATGKRTARATNPPKNTVIKKTALIREALANRKRLMENTEAGIDTVLAFGDNEAKTASRLTGAETVTATSRVQVSTQSDAATPNSLELHHLEGSV